MPVHRNRPRLPLRDVTNLSVASSSADECDISTGAAASSSDDERESDEEELDDSEKEDDEDSNMDDEIRLDAVPGQDDTADRSTNNNRKRGESAAMNLQCVKSVVKCFPFWNLQPPPSFRISVEKVAEFMELWKEEQWAAKRKFQELSTAEKETFTSQIPGAACSCCMVARKARSDKGKKRGGGKKKTQSDDAIADPGSDHGSFRTRMRREPQGVEELQLR
jgi:hypothetical protein